MKTPIQGEVKLALESIPESFREELLAAKSQRYFWMNLTPSIRQLGHDFSFAVVPFQLSTDGQLRQNGQGVFCQTEAEARESAEMLTLRASQPIVLLDSIGFGCVGRITKLRQYVREQSVRWRVGAEGGKLWYALDREIDKATGEVTVLRRVETESEQSARQVARGWLEEFDLEKKTFLEASKKNPPPPPVRCDGLTASDICDDLPKAKWNALKRQWPNTCSLFEKHKANPSLAIRDHECQEAYLLDLVEKGYDPKEEYIRADLKFVAALHRAAQKFAKQGERKITGLAIYLIAFNWELGWCYLSDSDIAIKLKGILQARFTAIQVKKYRSRTLGLVAKHWPGPAPKSSV